MQRPLVVDEVSLNTIVQDANKFHGLRVRVKGVARIEFEGTAVYSELKAYESRQMRDAIWLTIGWPVSADTLQLNGREIVVEGVFDASQKGHYGAYAGALVDVGTLTKVQN